MILVAGHYCHDTLVGNAGSAEALGGSAAYASAILDALAEPHAVIAKVGRDFRYAAQVSHEPAVVAGRTTAFVDDYRGGERRQRVEAVAPPIEPFELEGRFELGIACAVAGELPLRTLLRMRELCGLLVADAQALLRAISPSGELVLQRPDPAALEALDCLKASRHEAALLDVQSLRKRKTLLITDGASGCDVLARDLETHVPAFPAGERDPTGAGDCLKASRHEAALLDVQSLRKRKTLLITDGARGCDVLARDLEAHVPAFPAGERDPTGAGDCFLAGVAAALLRGRDPVGAARAGAYCGARAVEHVGVPRLSAAQASAARALVAG